MFREAIQKKNLLLFGFFQFRLDPPLPAVFWNPSRNFFQTLILYELKFLKVFGLWLSPHRDQLNREIMKFLSSCGCCGCCQPNQTTDRRFVNEKDNEINSMLHQLLEACGLAKGQPGPCQQGVLHPAGAVRVGVVSPPLARAVRVLLSWELPRKIFLRP